MAAALSFFLIACQPADRAEQAKRIEAKWVDRQLLFVGDPAGKGSRLPPATGAATDRRVAGTGRSGVRDVSLDPAAGRIWVLGDGALYLHDARTFSLVKRIPAVGSGSVRLALDAGGAPLLIAENGAQLARIDPLSLAVEQRQLARQDPAEVRAAAGVRHVASVEIPRRRYTLHAFLPGPGVARPLSAGKRPACPLLSSCQRTAADRPRLTG